ncbi:guanylate kinase [Caldicellulosiruptor bescii]|uniref:Guanylate kinase n=2 Tax=Caldicellulosiruptor bescii TaxID=31899 RepID=B9MR32_CALBD|nr:guanylate kinase [Caldicellulosiruptor bescii]ACM60136.1 guanylate kinase [Caldicellulosiruptor bescii DSM 6725]PBC87551.1 guanylate kinase [Caldicellulosiruptor bescii]PBC90484.1 guanylate kinase [Caldicellulosiruptor bescii]PBD04084.1 guanylate kinase [Caldicellulosiruptor bescii]PBD06281.1 guanylate kinase [Caldicellulosiruptor bescii]
MREGLLIVISGPAGTGKGTVVGRLLEKNPNIKLSISKTTRKPRPGEKEGVNYFFVSREQFEEEIKNERFLEYAEYNNNYYGTPKDFVFEALGKGYDVILEIETKGALQIKKVFSDAVLIFLLPPSIEELYKRLVKRGTESEDEIRARLEIAKNEIKLVPEYDYCVINDNVDDAAEKIQKIIEVEKLKSRRFDIQSFLKE